MASDKAGTTPMASTKLLDAAQLIRRVNDDGDSADIVESIDIDGVQAVTLKNKVLVIPGTNEFADWFNFNLEVFADGRPERVGFDVVPGDSGARWHAGFLKHARYVYTFAKPQGIRLVIGHSLGAASAQIVGSSLGIPTIAFASPRPLLGGARFRGEGWVVNVCRTDDTVCHVPPDFLGFRHVGSVYWLSPPTPHVGEDHRIDAYIEAIEAGLSDTLPVAWPVAT